MISKTYCPLPFNHIYIHPTNMSSVCCAFRKGDELKAKLPNIKEYENLSDHLSHPFLKDIQQKMLKGEKVNGCATCYYAEEHGYTSMREKEIETWHSDRTDFNAPDVHNPKLQFVEVTFGNYCNLACRTCGSDLSHSWIEDSKKLKDLNLPAHPVKARMNIEREWKENDLTGLEYLKITGGEPMLHPDFSKFLDRLEQENIKCFIFTNASWVPKKRILNMLSKFKHCQIFLSIDGTGSVQEYTRHNAKWDITEASAIKWLEYSKENDNIQISWAPTWSNLNASYYVETCNWWLKTMNGILGKESEECSLVKTNFIYGPSHYQIGLLSNIEELKQEAVEYKNKLKTSTFHGTREVIEMTEALITFYENDKQEEKIKYETKTNSEMFFDMTTALDDMRDQSFEKMLPLTYNAMNASKRGLNE